MSIRPSTFTASWWKRRIRSAYTNILCRKSNARSSVSIPAVVKQPAMNGVAGTSGLRILYLCSARQGSK